MNLRNVTEDNPMCYSAQIETDYRKYTRELGAQLSLEEFVNLYWRQIGRAHV